MPDSLKNINSFSERAQKIAQDAFDKLNIPTSQSDLIDRSLIFVIILFIAFGVYLLFNKLLIRFVEKIVKKVHFSFGNVLFNNRFFHRLFGLIPPLLILIFLPIAFSASSYKYIYGTIQKGCIVFITFCIARIFISVIRSFYDYYLIKHQLKKSTYRGVLDMAVLLIWVIAFLFMIGEIFNVDMTHVATGLSAFAAILVLVFKDTLLGFVSGVQISQNRMINIGDWIVVPNSEANGTVVDITILTVKVQNFDNTFVFVPAYQLVSSPFKNWSGMSESGQRRVMKSLYIDVNSICPTTDELLKTVEKEAVLQEYIEKQQITSLRDDNTVYQPTLDTNVGLFRFWAKILLQQHDQVTPAPYLIVQASEAQGKGLPITFYFFVNTTDWIQFEQIQSAIFESFMSHLPLFGLRQFQYGQLPEAYTPAEASLPPAAPAVAKADEKNALPADKDKAIESEKPVTSEDPSPEAPQDSVPDVDDEPTPIS